MCFILSYLKKKKKTSLKVSGFANRDGDNTQAKMFYSKYGAKLIDNNTVARYTNFEVVINELNKKIGIQKYVNFENNELEM